MTHPRRGYREEASVWLVGLRREGVRVIVPEIADYELRRELIRAGSGTERLDALEDRLVYLPITTPVMRQAARLWADARNRGRPTAPDPALDCDVILAAQTLTVEEELEINGIIATTNPDHLSRYVAAADWRDIGSATSGGSEPGGET